jgi:uncharacterized protein YciI
MTVTADLTAARKVRSDPAVVGAGQDRGTLLAVGPRFPETDGGCRWCAVMAANHAAEPDEQQEPAETRERALRTSTAQLRRNIINRRISAGKLLQN